MTRLLPPRRKQETAQTEFVRKHPLANCEECPLYERGRMVPTHFGANIHSGDLPGDSNSGDNQRRVIAFVVEAPAKQEIAKGTPFVGASGQLLPSVLDQYGVGRDDVVLTNATLCHYPESMKKMPKEAIECCRPRLLQELEDSK